ncbi:hypothetical protein BMS3Bbin02_01769 [bacterium BMS3Bbin02]|nr:hypothetical protein BMS3Bbin02_01769 [bacterium BMS3Bbin02]
MNNSRVWTGVGVVVLLLVAFAVTRPTWNVRNGSAEVAEFVIEARVFDGFETDIVWNCDTYVATVGLPAGVDHWSYVNTLSDRLTGIGFARLTRYEYQHDRADSLDFDTVSVDPPTGEEAATATVRMTVFDTDSTFCIPKRLAVPLG